MKKYRKLILIVVFVLFSISLVSSTKCCTNEACEVCQFCSGASDYCDPSNPDGTCRDIDCPSGCGTTCFDHLQCNCCRECASHTCSYYDCGNCKCSENCNAKCDDNSDCTTGYYCDTVDCICRWGGGGGATTTTLSCTPGTCCSMGGCKKGKWSTGCSCNPDCNSDCLDGCSWCECQCAWYPTSNECKECSGGTTVTTKKTTKTTTTTTTIPQRNAQFISQSPMWCNPMCLNQQENVQITMKNTGILTWTPDDGNSPDNGYKLGSQNPQDNLNWGISRVNVETDVPPGETYTFSFTITASTLGQVNFQWRMVQENIEWFGQYTPNTVIEVIDSYKINSVVASKTNLNPKENFQCYVNVDKQTCCTKCKIRNQSGQDVFECDWSNWDGFTAIFDCTAPTTPGMYELVGYNFCPGCGNIEKETTITVSGKTTTKTSTIAPTTTTFCECTTNDDCPNYKYCDSTSCGTCVDLTQYAIDCNYFDYCENGKKPGTNDNCEWMENCYWKNAEDKIGNDDEDMEFFLNLCHDESRANHALFIECDFPQPG